MNSSQNPAKPHHWFSVYGIELEYMLVDERTLDVRPIADKLLEAMGGPGAAAVARGSVSWSNELARHVIELKTNGPVAELSDVPQLFAQAVTELEQLAAKEGARLMPGGMHPWMRPEKEFQLWPQDPELIYATFHRIFDCRGHGWANLQSMHLNLPFADDREFFSLHAAVRFVLPLLPALAAASPIVEGAYARHLDERLAVYRTNARLVPEVSGHIIPESARGRREYEDVILGNIYRALSPHDPERVLCEEWVNARGAIARFDRMAVEIRVLDAQESPRADLATAYLIAETLRPLAISGHFTELDALFSSERLALIYRDAVQYGEEARITDLEFLRAWQLDAREPMLLREVWQELLRRIPQENRHAELYSDAKFTVERGPLARRIRRALPPQPSATELQRVYRSLCDCLRANQRFVV